MRADVRILAASNSDLDAAVKENMFRSDLLYRINSIPIRIPPLRDRREDILPLAYHFLRQFARKYRKEIQGFSPLALAQLEGYEWPGNVRELEHTVGQAVLFTSGREINEVIHRQSIEKEHQISDSYRVAKGQLLEEFEHEFLARAIQTTGGNLSQAARLAGLERSSFIRLLSRTTIFPREAQKDSPPVVVNER